MHFNVAPCETLPSDRAFTKDNPIFKVRFAGALRSKQRDRRVERCMGQD